MKGPTVEKQTHGRSVTLSSVWRRRFFPRRTGTLLDGALPEYDFRGEVSQEIHATPHQIFRAMNEVTLADMPLAYALGTLRYLPARLAGRAQSDPGNQQPFLRQLTATGTVVLAKRRDQELVLGGIGKYHQILDQKPVPLRNAGDFAHFDDPDYQKLAMAIRVSEKSADDGHM